MTGMQIGAGRPLNKLALAALVTGVFLLAPIALVLGIVAIFQIRKRGEDGLVLACLAIVISLLLPGAFAAFVWGNPPGLDACLHVQDKAISALRMVAYLEEDFHKREGRYGTLKEISWGPSIDVKPYTYELVYARENEFLAVARGIGPVAGDELLIDQNRKVQRVVDKCRR